MALSKCKECGGPVSTLAAACPRCGAPPPPQKTGPKDDPDRASAIATLVVVGVVFSVIVGFWLSSKSEPTPPKAVAQPKPECAKSDLTCRGNEGVISAGIYCRSAVERLARHSMRWTDGTFEPKFSHFKWTNKPGEGITYIGDKAEFQNGFGAYTAMTYFCDLADDKQTVVGARVREGRL